MPRLIPVNNAILEGDFIWNAGLVGGLCLVAFGVLWWLLSWRLGFDNRWAVIPAVLGFAAVIRSLWQTIKATFA